MKQMNQFCVPEKELTIRRSRVTPTELPVAVCDLADMLAEIAFRQWQVASQSQLQGENP